MLDTATIGYSLEGVLVLGGVGLLVRHARWARRQPGTIPALRLPRRHAPLEDALFCFLTMGLAMLMGQVGVWLGSRYFPAADAAHLTLGATYVVELTMVALIALYHRFLWARVDTGGTRPPGAFELPSGRPNAPGGRVPPLPAVSTGVITFLVALPAVYLVAALWQGLLELCHYPVSHQNIVEAFLGLTTPLAQVLFGLVAAILVPFNEEMLFRGGLFRSLRAVLPRPYAIGISALVFAALHFDVTSFLPLTVLGVALAIAYERTGNIRTVILAHALFNLNTLVALMLGVNS
jgi:membrane protease YdiL (CAAX protease family)